MVLHALLCLNLKYDIEDSIEVQCVSCIGFSITSKQL